MSGNISAPRNILHLLEAIGDVVFLGRHDAMSVKRLCIASGLL